MGRQVTVIKVPRKDVIIDKPAKFPKLDNLLLEFEEITEKAVTPIPALAKPNTIDINELPRYTQKSSQVETVEVVSDNKDEIPEDSEDNEEDEEEGEEEEGEEEEDEEENEDKNLVNDLGEDEPDDKDLIENLGENKKDNKPNEKETEIPPPPVNKYDGMTPEEIENSKRNKYLGRLKTLKKQWPSRALEVPVFNKHDDYLQIKNGYRSTYDEFTMDDKINNYRMYLRGAFYAAEFGGGMMGIDIEGFAKAQIKVMEKYDRMLIELGEKDRNRWQVNLPIEIKLIGFVILQMGMFWLAKKLGGQDAIEQIFALVTGGKKEVVNEENKTPKDTQEKPKPPTNIKMKGPSINVEELRKASQKNKNSLEQMD